MADLKGKKILLIANRGYSEQIKNDLAAEGAQVVHINDKPNDGFFAKSLGRLYVKPYVSLVLEKYYAREIEKNRDADFDYILSIRGEYTPVESLKQLRKAFPRAKIILYMWDSLKNNRKVEARWPFYDTVWTFDRQDYLKHRDELKFLPLFYCESILPAEEEAPVYDLSFIGTGHGDRVAIAKEIARQCEQRGLSFFSYLYVPHVLVYCYNKLLNPDYRHVKISDVHFQRMNLQEVYQIYKQSRCVLDVESATQSGLTMRSVEILGLKRKLMTTNPEIRNYDFYNSDDFAVFERKKPQIDTTFIASPFVPLPAEIYERYSLKSWLETIFADGENTIS